MSQLLLLVNSLFSRTNIHKTLLVIAFIALFIFTRFFLIDDGLYFFNDMGRDLLVLYDWIHSGKMPFVGPQTSALPINQSPLFFYLLMPFYLISNQSPFTALYLSAFLSIGSLLLCLYVSRNLPQIQDRVVVIFLLMVLHPQYIIQNRFVWNPSILPPFLIASLVFFLIYFYKKKLPYLIISIALVSVAISLHYSAIPVLISYLVTLFFLEKKQLLYAIAISTIVVCIFNITTIVQIIKRVFVEGTIFRSNEVYQVGSTYTEKINGYIQHAIGIPVNPVAYLLLLSLMFGAVYLIFKSKDKTQKTISLLFILTSFITLLSPFNIQAHYIFAITVMLFAFIAFLPRHFMFMTLILLFFFYLNPGQFVSYFNKAPRSYEQLNACFKYYCYTVKEPLFVSVQSNLYPYHFGPEHRYLLKKNGCDIKEIEKEPGSAKSMAVVLDSGSFSPETHYYELDLFGKFEETRRYRCQSNLGIVQIKKIE